MDNGTKHCLNFFLEFLNVNLVAFFLLTSFSLGSLFSKMHRKTSINVSSSLFSTMKLFLLKHS